MKNSSGMLFVLSVCVLLALFPLTVFLTDFPPTYGKKTPMQTSFFRNSNVYHMVAFGYTMCKSVCPATVANLRNISEKLKTSPIDFTFVSVDDSDDVKRLQKFQNATGIKRVLSSREGAGLIQDLRSGKMDNHTAYLFLITPQGTVYIYPSGKPDAGKIRTDLLSMNKDINEKY